VIQKHVGLRMGPMVSTAYNTLYIRYKANCSGKSQVNSDDGSQNLQNYNGIYPNNSLYITILPHIYIACYII
jgi:hypothetical protein